MTWLDLVQHGGAFVVLICAIVKSLELLVSGRPERVSEPDGDVGEAPATSLFPEDRGLRSERLGGLSASALWR